MTTQDLRHGRKAARLSQTEAANKLGVSQPYLSLLEQGQRAVPPRLARKAATLYRLSPTTLPFTSSQKRVSSELLAKAVAALGYPGFAHLRSHMRRNPAQVLSSALSQDNLETRVTESLPWVVWQYAGGLDWNLLVGYAKQHDLQNRLGFVTAFARQVAEVRGDTNRASLLKSREDELDHARLAREDTLCHASLSQPERGWLREHRPAEARHWNLLTDLKPEHVEYARA